MFHGIVLNMLLGAVLFTSERQFTEGQHCPIEKKIVVLYRSYFDYYLAKNTTPSTVGSNEQDPSGLFPKVFRRAVTRCCDWIEVDFVPLSESDFGFYNQEDIETVAWSIFNDPRYRSTNTLAFLFPVFANKGVKRVFLDSFSFLALTTSAGHAIVMRKRDYNIRVPVGAIFSSFVSMFSMITVLALLVGTIAWFLEHRNNRLEFPAPFVLGVFEGFWWSIVTMTTVGYGDKSPKSRVTRVLAFAWMVFSAIFLSLFTANASSLLTLSRGTQYDKTIGHNIGVLHSRLFVENELNLGAFIQEYRNQSILTNALMENEVDRILFPNYLDYLFRLSIPQFGKELKSKYKIATVLHKPFDIGLAALSYHIANAYFFGCLKFHILRAEKQLKWNYSGIIHEDESIEIHNGFPYAWGVSGLCLIILGSFIVLGVAFDIWKYFKKGTEERDPESPSDNKEPKPITKENSWFSNRIFS